MNQSHPAMTRRETIHGGSTPASMRVTVIAGYAQFMSPAVNGTAVINLSKHHEQVIDTGQQHLSHRNDPAVYINTHFSNTDHPQTLQPMQE